MLFHNPHIQRKNNNEAITMTQNDKKSSSFTVDKTRELEQEKIIFKELYEYLSSHEKISNEVFDSMSHELRTPIVTIKADTDMLYKGNFGDITPEQKEKVERIKKNIDLLIAAIFKMLEKKKKVKSD